MPTSGEVDRTPSENRELAAAAMRMREIGLAIPVATAATYDTTTEGRTGWRFVLSRRWVIYIAAAILFAASCVLGVVWQAGQWQQITSFNRVVTRNFHAPTVPLATVLPTTGSYRSANQWRPVVATGRYLVSQQLFVRARSCATVDGFEVLTPLLLADGSKLIVDRGCVGASKKDSDLPASTPAPPSGQVTVTARVVASEPNEGSPSGNQVESIDLKQIAGKLGGTVYTGAYGLLASQSPPATRALPPVIAGRPLIDTTTQTVTIFAMGLYVLVGLFIFGFALRQQFRWVNRFSPHLWMSEVRRIQRLSRKAYTDEELEDQQVRRDVAGSRPSAPPVPSEPNEQAGSTPAAEDNESLSDDQSDDQSGDPGSGSDLIARDGSFQWTDDRAPKE